MYECFCACIYGYMHVCIYVWVHAYIFVYIRACMLAHLHICTYIYIYIYIYIYRERERERENKLDSNYTRMLREILNKPWRQHHTKQQLYCHLSTITKTIQVRVTRHAGHCWRNKDEIISDVLLWTPSHRRPAQTYILQLCADTRCNPEDLPEIMDDLEGWREKIIRLIWKRWTPSHGRAKARQPAQIYIQQPCADTRCNPEDLPEAMDDKEGRRERFKDICAYCAMGWWWWWYICMYIFKHVCLYSFTQPTHG